jgi:hypothetical protein
MVITSLCKLIAYTPTLLAVAWEVVCYVWTYIIWRTPTSYPGGKDNYPPSYSSLLDNFLSPNSMFISRHIIILLAGPRNKALLRRGKWLDVASFMTSGGWHFAEAEESHDVSLRADSRYELTGEAAGRQIWHQEQHQHQQQEGGACREKSFRFNAAENPNSSDQVFRDQMLRRWAAAGKELPDSEAAPPGSAKEAAVKGLQFYQMIQCEDGHWAGDYGGEDNPD